jgi:hypothetical protein
MSTEPDPRMLTPELFAALMGAIEQSRIAVRLNYPDIQADDVHVGFYQACMVKAGMGARSLQPDAATRLELVAGMVRNFARAAQLDWQALQNSMGRIRE